MKSKQSAGTEQDITPMLLWVTAAYLESWVFQTKLCSPRHKHSSYIGVNSLDISESLKQAKTKEKKNQTFNAELISLLTQQQIANSIF